VLIRYENINPWQGGSNRAVELDRAAHIDAVGDHLLTHARSLGTSRPYGDSPCGGRFQERRPYLHHLAPRQAMKAVSILRCLSHSRSSTQLHIYIVMSLVVPHALKRRYKMRSMRGVRGRNSLLFLSLLWGQRIRVPLNVKTSRVFRNQTFQRRAGQGCEATQTAYVTSVS